MMWRTPPAAVELAPPPCATIAHPADAAAPHAASANPPSPCGNQCDRRPEGCRAPDCHVNEDPELEAEYRAERVHEQSRGELDVWQLYDGFDEPDDPTDTPF